MSSVSGFSSIADAPGVALASPVTMESGENPVTQVAEQALKKLPPAARDPLAPVSPNTPHADVRGGSQQSSPGDHCVRYCEIKRIWTTTKVPSPATRVLQFLSAPVDTPTAPPAPAVASRPSTPTQRVWHDGHIWRCGKQF
ncbi:MAG: hypothetical protein JSR76_01810 [Verrucomicrobia bacterium]|nr:hypothetical protein [Verrucomicrobiota bacterium]